MPHSGGNLQQKEKLMAKRVGNFTDETFAQYLNGPRNFMGWKSRTSKVNVGDLIYCLAKKSKTEKGNRVVAVLRVIDNKFYTAVRGSAQDIWDGAFREQLKTEEVYVFTETFGVPNVTLPHGKLRAFSHSMPVELHDAMVIEALDNYIDAVANRQKNSEIATNVVASIGSETIDAEKILASLDFNSPNIEFYLKLLVSKQEATNKLLTQLLDVWTEI